MNKEEMLKNIQMRMISRIKGEEIIRSEEKDRIALFIRIEIIINGEIDMRGNTIVIKEIIRKEMIKEDIEIEMIKMIKGIIRKVIIKEIIQEDKILMIIRIKMIKGSIRIDIFIETMNKGNIKNVNIEVMLEEAVGDISIKDRNFKIVIIKEIIIKKEKEDKREISKEMKVLKLMK